jgi:hypothetical protein
MADQAKGASRSSTWLWMLLAVVAVVGFLTWIGLASEPTSVTVVEGDEEGDEADLAADSGVVVVVKDTLAADKSRFVGQRVRVSQVEATGNLGDRIFWGELGDRANQVPILIRMDSAAAEGFQVQSGGLYTVTGEVQQMTDSLAALWSEQNEFAGEGEQMQAAFADYFIQVSNIRPSRAPRSGAGGDGGSAGSGG